MTIQRLKNLRLMTQRYLVLALVGWLASVKTLNALTQVIGQVRICPTSTQNVDISWGKSSLMKNLKATRNS